mmetsp:Transcript_10467/g.21638  ORF Transcript_10467/g.21638 Transcript_10467/m.21638 type:complete len:296 (-) Transcript_10467:337-1224(-)
MLNQKWMPPWSAPGGLPQPPSVDLRGGLERLQRGDAHALRGPRLVNVLAAHLAVLQDLQLDAALRPCHDLVGHRRGHLDDLGQALHEAEPCGDVLGEVPVLQVRHELPVYLLARMREAVVTLVRVHAGLQGGGVGHLAVVAVQVPLLQGAGVLQAKAGAERLHLAADGLRLLRHLHKDVFRVVVHALVEERLRVLGRAVPDFGVPAAKHDTGMDNHPRVAQADAEVVRALLQPGRNPDETLQGRQRVGRLRRRGHRPDDAVLDAQDCRLLAPLGEAASPRQRLEAAEDHVLGFIA